MIFEIQFKLFKLLDARIFNFVYFIDKNLRISINCFGFMLNSIKSFE